MGMAKLFYILLSFVLVFAFIACTGEKTEEQAETETEAEATVEKALDENMAECASGCGMTMEKEKMVAHEHDGETLYFCSDKCKDDYLAKEKEEGEAEEGETES
jgi:YHS domain-containing protein